MSKNLSLYTLSSISCGVLFFVMGKFTLTDILGCKRFLQVFFITPIFFSSIFIIAKNINSLCNNYSIFVFIFVFISILYGVQINIVFSMLFSLLSIILLSAVNIKNIVYASKTVVGLAAFFSILGIIHFFILLINPEFVEHGKVFMQTDGIHVDELDFYSLIGLVDGSSYSLFGFPITRIRSFASEPSLLILYFFFPAILSLLIRDKVWNNLVFPICFCCFLSFSGIVLLSFFLSFLTFISIPRIGVEKIKIAFIFLGIVILLDFVSGNTDSYMSFLDGLKSHGDFFEKTRSFNARTLGISNAFTMAASSPFGSNYIIDAPAPIFVNASIRAGWLAGALIIIIIWKLFSLTSLFVVKHKGGFYSRIFTSLCFSGLFVTSTISDYGMTGYSGIIILFLIYKMLNYRLFLSV